MELIRKRGAHSAKCQPVIDRMAPAVFGAFSLACILGFSPPSITYNRDVGRLLLIAAVAAYLAAHLIGQKLAIKRTTWLWLALHSAHRRTHFRVISAVLGGVSDRGALRPG